MWTFTSFIKPYLKPLPLDDKKYLFKENAGHGLISVKLKDIKDPIFLRAGSFDVKTFNHVYHFREYDFDFRPGFDPKVIFDCGANIGLTSIYFANKFPNATIISVEPELGNFELLQKNTESYPNIICLNYGIWSKTTNLEIIDSGYGSWAFTTLETNKQNENTIKAISIDATMERFNVKKIDLLKIDIEGSETEIFDNGSDKWLPNVDTLIIELHDRFKKGTAKSFFKALMSYDFSMDQREQNIICYLGGKAKINTLTAE